MVTSQEIDPTESPLDPDATQMQPPVSGTVDDDDDEDSGLHEPEVLSAHEVPVSELPSETLAYVLASRYCETDHT
jgi:hypothetical protein